MPCCRDVFVADSWGRLYWNALLSWLVWFVMDRQRNSTFDCFSGFHLDLQHHIITHFSVQCLLAKQLRISSRVPMGSVLDLVKVSLMNTLLISVTCVTNTHLFTVDIVLCQRNITLKLQLITCHLVSYLNFCSFAVKVVWVFPLKIDFQWFIT